MLRRKVKSILSLTLSAAMVVGTLGSAMPVNAAELEKESTEISPLWETVDAEEEFEVASDLENSEEVVEEKPEYADDENVRVMIVFDEKGVVDKGYAPEEIATNKAAQKISDNLEKEQDEIIDVIEKEALNGESLETRYSFTLLTNAVSADIAFGQIEEIEAIDGVEAVYVTPAYELQKTADEANPNTMTSGEMVGSYQTWSAGYTGAGMRVAVIDTGLDTDHPSFNEGAYMYSMLKTSMAAGKRIEDYKILQKKEITTKLDSLNAYKKYSGLKANDVYVSAKVPFAFNYVDKSLDVTHDNDEQGDHGTHVSGIAAANKYIHTSKGYELQESGVVGIAPDAQLFAMKVFGKGGGAYPDDYMAAIEDALVLGADTINLSLGSSSAGESVATEEYLNTVMNKLFGTKTVVSISAGNADSWSSNGPLGYNLTTDVNADTVGSPGSYTNAFTVASAINSGYTASAVRVADQYNAFYADGSSANNAPFTSLDKTGKGSTYDYVLFDTFGEPSDFEGVDVKGKIVFVSRGTISFFEKHDNAAKAGAAGVLVYNNTSGTINMNLTGSTSTIPCASIKQADAEAIRTISTYNKAKGIYTGKLVVSNKVMTDHNVSDGYLMSDFSSWGVPGDLALKPEITAPGGNIYSTLTNGEYGLMSGTSMAAPSVAGISALVLQYVKENKLAAKTGLSARALAQALLMSTAEQLTEADGSVYSPRKQGAGLANASYATTTPAYLLVGNKATNDGKVKVELGDDPAKKGQYTFEFTVNNLTSDKLYYNVEGIVLTEGVVTDGADKYIANNSYVLSTVPTFTSSSLEILYDLNADKHINSKDVDLLTKYVNGQMKLPKVDFCADEFDFNKDGVIDAEDVKLYKRGMTVDFTLFDWSRKVLVVDKTATVKATIKLNSKDKNYLNKNFANGMFVEGFVTLKGGVELSLPYMGFYGNWTESSMFEPYNYLENPTGISYTGVVTNNTKTNYFTYQLPGSTSRYYFPGNFYATDDEYIADRNAMSSEAGAAVASAQYTLIRNAASVVASVKNAETGEVYYETKKGAATGAYYSSSQGQWNNISSSVSFNWKGTDASGKALADGTKVNISVTALPAYYNDGTKVPGKGATLSLPMTIDNTAPEVTNLTTDEEGKMTVTVKDNQYVAAVLVIGADKSTIIGRYAVNQKTPNTESEVVFDYPDSIFYLRVIDYAGNGVTGRINMTGEEDTTVPESIMIDQESVTLLKGNTVALEAVVGPESLLEEYSAVVWSSEDESIASVDDRGVVTANSVGTTKVVATTVTPGKDGEVLSAECEVNVITLSVDLNTTLWDEAGEVYFSSFNTADLSKYNKLSDSMSAPFWSAVDMDGKLLASAYSKDQSTSDYYFADPDNGYETTYVATDLWSTDLAYGEVITGCAFGTYAYFVNVIDENGEIIGQLDLSKFTGGEYLVGIAYIGVVNAGALADAFVAIDRSGKMYLIFVTSDFRFGCVEYGETGISTNGMWYYESLYYDWDNDMFFYSVYDKSDEVTLYAIDAEDNVYSLGQFPSGVWPISGLYQWYTFGDDAKAKISVDLSSVEFENMTSGVTSKRFNVNSVKEFKVVENEEVEVEAVVSEEVVEEEIIEEEILEDELKDEEETSEETVEDDSDVVEDSEEE